jgi:hypothetical protein
MNKLYDMLPLHDIIIDTINDFFYFFLLNRKLQNYVNGLEFDFVFFFFLIKKMLKK